MWCGVVRYIPAFLCECPDPALPACLHSDQVFDPTESAGLGLLNEMSLIETKARLEANERRRREAEENKRREILLERAEREADLRER